MPTDTATKTTEDQQKIDDYALAALSYLGSKVASKAAHKTASVFFGAEAPEREENLENER